MIWIIASALFLLFVTKGAFLGAQPLLEIGNTIKMDWRDILALLIVGVVIYLLATDKISGKEILAILGAIIGGKAISS